MKITLTDKNCIIRDHKKDGTKYKLDDGTAGWYVSIKSNDKWWGNMVWGEEFLPSIGATIEVELVESDDGFNNWKYKLLTKKEQLKQMTDVALKEMNQSCPPPPTQEYEPQQKPDWDAIAEGKVRHGVAIAFIEKGKELSDTTKAEILEWTDFIIKGK